jgi:hypothetical protein
MDPSRNIDMALVEHESDRHIRQILRLCRALISLADRGEACAEDNGCFILYGKVRDCAYQIREMAQLERQTHEDKGRRGPVGRW